MQNGWCLPGSNVLGQWPPFGGCTSDFGDRAVTESSVFYRQPARDLYGFSPSPPAFRAGWGPDNPTKGLVPEPGHCKVLSPAVECFWACWNLLTGAPGFRSNVPLKGPEAAPAPCLGLSDTGSRGSSLGCSSEGDSPPDIPGLIGPWARSRIERTGSLVTPQVPMPFLQRGAHAVPSLLLLSLCQHVCSMVGTGAQNSPGKTVS